MRTLDVAEQTAISQRVVVARDLVRIIAKDRDTGDPVPRAFWSDVGTVTLSVLDALTGASTDYDFYGVGAAMVIGSIPLTSDITVRSVDVEVPAIDAIVEALVRTDDVRNAPIQIWRAYLDKDTRLQAAIAKYRFVGFVDGAPIVTPKEGGSGTVTLNCVSVTRELTRVSSEVRSHESQIKRAAGDTFLKDTDRVADFDIAWARTRTTPGNAAGSARRAGSSGGN